MELPDDMPDRLLRLHAMNSETELFVSIKDDPEELITFFETACADESWAKQHTALIATLLTHLTDSFRTLVLPHQHALRARKTIHEHYPILAPHLPSDITILVDSNTAAANSLMVATSSPYLHNIFHTDCVDNSGTQIRLRTGSYDGFLTSLEYINSGMVKDIWKYDRSQTEKLMQEADGWDLQGLVTLCALHLKRYLNPTNVLNYLELGHERRWPALCTACYEFLNKQDIGLKFLTHSADTLSVEFIRYRDEGSEIFDRLRPLITHLKFNGRMVEDSRFSAIMEGVPTLIGLDLSATKCYGERLMDIPQSVEELDVSSCEWINDMTLVALINHLPRLKKLNVESNSNIFYKGWSALYNLKALTHFDCARCLQIQNDDLKLICRSCPSLEWLNLEECTKLTDVGFIEIAKNALPLLSLNLSRTGVSNTPIAEICLRCKRIKQISLDRCPAVTEKELIRLRQLYPQLTIML